MCILMRNPGYYGKLMLLAAFVVTGMICASAVAWHWVANF